MRKEALRRAGCALAALLCAAALAGPLFPARAAERGSISEVVSDSYIVMDAATGQVLISKNPDKIKYPASITKILTLALALQHGSLDDTFTVTETAAAVDYDAANIALQPGEVITVRDAVMATLLASANDAANCLAEYVSGSQAAFVDLMNQTAASLGCTDTHFTNPSGLPDPEHVTTARDMALITRWALSVDGFRDVFGTTFYTMPATNLQPETRSWGTQNAMIVESAFYVDGAWGGKLGWTEDAHHTMVTTLTRDGHDLVLVTMDSIDKYAKYWDALCILDTCWQRLAYVEADGSQAGTREVPVYAGDRLLGSAAYTAGTLGLYVPVGTDAGALTMAWQLPERLEAGSEGPGQLTVTIPNAQSAGLETGTVTFDIAPGDLFEVQAAWKGLRTEDDGTAAGAMAVVKSVRSRPWRALGRTAGILVCVLAALVLLAFCVRWTNRVRRNLRRYGTLRRPSAADPPRRAVPAGEAVHMSVRRPDTSPAGRRRR